jgi:hypothetical protein
MLQYQKKYVFAQILLQQACIQTEVILDLTMWEIQGLINWFLYPNNLCSGGVPINCFFFWGAGQKLGVWYPEDEERGRLGRGGRRGKGRRVGVGMGRGRGGE